MELWLDKELRDKLIHINIQSQIGSISIQINYLLLSNRNAFIFEHSHKCSELHYLIQGQEILLIDNRRLRLQEGMIYYVSPNILHSKILDLPENESYLKFIINFELKKVPTPHLKTIPYAEYEMIALEKHIEQHSYWVGEDTVGCINIIRNIFKELSNGRVGYYSVVQNMIANLIVLTIRCMSEHGVADYKVPIKINENYALRIVSFIKHNFSNNITREDAARAVSISTRHINRILQEHYGLTFQQMLQEYRIEMVKKLLSESEHSLERIAEDVGFGSASYLSKLFKEKEGMTTSAFRQQTR